MTRALMLGAGLLALAACSTHDNLLAPDREQLVSPEPRDDEEGRGSDPVCGTLLDETDDVWHATYQGVDYAFHSEDCRRQFEEFPELYSATVR